jgi:carboxymethylenebutenolidase
MRSLLVLAVLITTAVPARAVTPDCHPASSVESGPLLAVAAGKPSPRAPRPGEAQSQGKRHRRVPRPAGADTAMVHLGPADAGTEAFVAYPVGTAPAPAVIVVHEWWGLNAQIREMARSLARQGYVAIVPDLYHGKVASDPEAAHVLMRGLDEDGAVSDLAAAAAWVRDEPRTASRHYGVMGFCMGGHLAELLAFRDSKVSAAVVFYGVPETRPERIAALRAPLIGHFGTEDQGIDTSRVETFRRALEGAGKKAEIYVYAGAGHAFMNQEQKSYRPEAARLAWVRTLAFLQKYLKGLS